MTAVRVRKILSLLEKAYPDAALVLHYKNPLELLVATILAAQCTDERVNKVTEILFKNTRQQGITQARNKRFLNKRSVLRVFIKTRQRISLLVVRNLLKDLEERCLILWKTLRNSGDTIRIYWLCF